MRKFCVVCGTGYEAKRADRLYCDEKCAKRAQRQPKTIKRHSPGVNPVDFAPTAVDGALFVATLTELEAVGRQDSASGQAALLAARRLDAGQSETGSSVAALLREHAARLADAVRDAKPQRDLLDELRDRRDRRIAG